MRFRMMCSMKLKKLQLFREKLESERESNLRNEGYLLRRAAEFSHAGDKDAKTAYLLQAESLRRK